MPDHRSIGERIRRAKSVDALAETTIDWAANWRREQERLVAEIGAALRADDTARVGRALAQLRGLTDKRFSALEGVLEHLLDGIEGAENEQGEEVPDA